MHGFPRYETLFVRSLPVLHHVQKSFLLV
jgi:hypothetical protein